MDENTIKYILIATVLIAFFSIMSSGSKDKRTDGVFEGAMEKIDAGKPLTAAEQQRVSDIINWCDRCNGPQRNCSH